MVDLLLIQTNILRIENSTEKNNLIVKKIMIEGKQENNEINSSISGNIW